MQQFAIAASHEAFAVGNQAARPVLAGIGFLIGLGATKAEQDFGDLAIARAG